MPKRRQRRQIGKSAFKSKPPTKNVNPSRDKHICLAMIVKNESKIITRMLDSLIGVIDTASIVDTGSTDNTVSLIQTWGVENNIPVTVHHEPFVNFAYSRTHSFRKAKETYPEADYFLLSDADFMWVIDTPLIKRLLFSDKYEVIQKNGSTSYKNTRLVSAKHDWECVGVTHEYWSVDDIHLSSDLLKSIWIDDKGDGGCKSDKYDRDKRLLKEGLRDPTTKPHLTTRYRFYLAQTYKDLGEPLKAIRHYKDRISDKGWAEEIYYSLYKIGDCYERLANTYPVGNGLYAEYSFQSIYYYLQAYLYRPTRLEALGLCVKALNYFRFYDYAYTLSMLGKEVPMSTDGLFIEPMYYTYFFQYQLSVCCYFLSKREEGIKNIDEVLECRDVPECVIAQTKKNAQFYL